MFNNDNDSSSSNDKPSNDIDEFIKVICRNQNSESQENEKNLFRKLDRSSILYKTGKDLTYMIQESESLQNEFITDRQHLLSKIISILGMRKKGNPLLIGEAGCGKTFLVNCLANYIIKQGDNAPEWIRRKRIVSLKFEDVLSTIDSETTWQWQDYIKKLKLIIEEASKTPTILFMDEIHSISQYNMSCDVLKPALANGEIKVIGATTKEEYYQFFDKYTALARRFQKVEIPVMNKSETISVLMKEKIILEKAYQMNIPDSLIEDTLTYSTEYLPYYNQPDISVEIMERMAINTIMLKNNVVTKDDLRTIIADITHVPIEIINRDIKQLSGLEEAMKTNIKGQDEAIHRVVERLKITRSNTQINPNRPLGVFLFCGPSGVGKTEFAKALAINMTGSEDNLVRFDMSIYNEHGSLQALLAPITKGNAGSEPSLPLLTKELKKHSYCVLLLDEIEKANHEIYNMLLQVFDYGQLVDFISNKIFFKNVIIIMTSNLGYKKQTKIRLQSGNQNYKAEEAMDEVTSFFPKEFVGRIDEIIFFNPLTCEDIDAFIEQKINLLSNSIQKKLEISSEVKQIIHEQGFSANYGARMLNRTIDSIIGKALADLKSEKNDWEKISVIQVVLNKTNNFVEAREKI